MVQHLLQFPDEPAQMEPVAHGVVHLCGQGKQDGPVLFMVLTHGEDVYKRQA